MAHQCVGQNFIFWCAKSAMAQWLSWLERRPVTAEVTGSSPVWVVICTDSKNLRTATSAKRMLVVDIKNEFIMTLAPLEYIRYRLDKARSGGAQPVTIKDRDICRSGGIGRRPGLKIPWVVIPVPVRPRPAALFRNLAYYIC